MPVIKKKTETKTKAKPEQAKFKFSEGRIKWSEFREKWKDCEACPLHTTRHRIVLAKGSVPCDVLFVGEAPGKSEDTAGLPFHGPAGKLLDEMVDEATKDFIVGELCDDDVEPFRPRVAYTNILCCIPAEEDGTKIENLGEHPHAAEYAKACSARLVEFITRVAQPKLVVCVGKYSTKYLKKFVPHRDFQYVEITHPAAILRADVGQKGLLMQRNIVALRDAFEALLEVKSC